jgi:FKBP-type peptidyl-prolyl cis-trans isomerase 2
MKKMPIEKGDFILISYVGKVKETNDVFDTTIEDVAKKERLYKEGEIYEPQLVVVGEGWVLKALDESLLNFEVGKKNSAEIPPEKAFGNRDPEKVRMMPLRRLIAKGITPQLGARIEIDGKLATVRTVGAGRVQLDFNPPLAGKTLIYEVTIEKKIDKKAEKLAAVIHRRIPSVDIKKFDLKLTQKAFTLAFPEEAFYIEGVQLAKRGIAMDIQKFFPEIATINFVETFKKKEAEAKEEKKEEAKKETKEENPSNKENRK